MTLSVPGSVPAEAGFEEVADRLVAHVSVGGEDIEEGVEPLAGRMRGVEEDLTLAADSAGASRQFAERFLTDAVAEIAGHLHRLLEEAERVGHRFSAPARRHRPSHHCRCRVSGGADPWHCGTR